MYHGVCNDKTYGMQIYFYSCALVVTLLMQQPIYVFNVLLDHFPLMVAQHVKLVNQVHLAMLVQVCV